MSSDSLRRLVAANAPYWAAEAEIVRTYWTSDARTRDADAMWLLRQCYKEYWDGFIPPFNRLAGEISDIDNGVPRETVLLHAEILTEEFAHYCAFADVYEALRMEDEPRVSPALLKTRGDWDANVELVTLRKEHKKQHGELGHRAHFCTEGGYCTLYAEGMKLKGQSDLGDLIAKACSLVYDDKFSHMLLGIGGLVETGMRDEDWEIMKELTVAQMHGRLHMRNAQFNFPIGEKRLGEMLAGKCEAMPFDWDSAGIEAPDNVVDMQSANAAKAS